MVTKRIFYMGILIIILSIFVSIGVVQHENKKQRIQMLSMEVQKQFNGIDYYARIVNNFTDLQDKYECAKDGKPFTGVRCNDNPPDEEELKHFGPEFFQGIVNNYRIYKNYSVESIDALMALIPYESKAYKDAVIAYQKWVIDQQSAAKLPVQGFEDWNAKFTKLLSDS